MESLERIKLGIGTICAIVLLATIGLMHFENWDFFTALYVVIITMSTVGYGDIIPTTFDGRILTLIYVICGTGAMAYTVASIAGFFIEGQFKKILRLKKMQNKLKKMNNHYILCGFGRIGKIVAKKFEKAGVPFVVIDADEKKILDELDRYKNLIYVVGDATSDDVLERAGVKKAKGLIASVSSDAENLFITLSAKGFNPNLYVVAKVDNDTSVNKLLKAGADRVVSPYTIGGLRIAELTLKPEILDFVSTLMDTTHDMEIGRFTISPNSVVVGKSISESKIRQSSGATILAIKKGDNVIINPSPNVILEVNDVIYAFGTKKHLDELKKILKDNNH
ncbi:potassium channel family protein [Methanothermococcus okinawensis]|uniref:TrkA-N domain protein n=1 Tax=Methanothermococcus okinawensis (strain DSM 14208 / JCM 11175 / IH1) TaxID=647113 RepID=F8AJY0_METOI|nr:potassium channel protein [Methanothermococcus okinawensis]AEH07336.1 TrkA-N domain protein [Methanothermococcus okinawensis IH1]